MRRRRDELLLSALDRAVRPDRAGRLPAHIWRWRYELVLAAAIVFIVGMTVHLLGTVWGMVVLSAAAGVCSPPWPPWLAQWAWHVITPHRIRVGLKQADIRSGNGWQPIVLRVITAEFGERVVLWCPAGTCAEDIQAARAILRSACWAADVRVHRCGQQAHITVVDVVRHGAGPRAHRGRPEPGAGPLDSDGCLLDPDEGLSLASGRW